MCGERGKGLAGCTADLDRSMRGDHDHRRVGCEPGNPAEYRERPEVGVVHVVECEHERPFFAPRVGQPHEAVDDDRVLLGTGLERRSAASGVAERVLHGCDRILHGVASGGIRRFGDTERVQHRPERPRIEGAAAGGQNHDVAAAGVVHHRGEQRGLPDAGLALHEYEAGRRATCRFTDGLAQQSSLVRPPDEASRTRHETSVPAGPISS